MAAKNQDLLIELVKGQAKLTETVDIMNTRLFGGEGQDGALKFMYNKHEEHAKAFQEVKERISTEIKNLSEKEIKPLELEVATLKTEATVNTWKIGSLTGLGGAGVGVGVTMLLKKLFGV